MVDEHYWNCQQQALASIIFDRTVDPIVRRLLVLDNLSRQSKETQQNDNAVANNISSGEPGLELERLKQVKQLLSKLRLALNSVMELVNAKKDEIRDNIDYKIQWQSRLLNQINGIALPLFSVMRQHLPNEQHNSSYSDQRMRFIVRSAAYSCIEEAALSVIALWKCRQNIIPFDKDISDEDSSDKENDNYSLILTGLMSCAMALSSIDISHDEKSNGDNKFNNVSKHNEALDRGEDCAVAILRCMQSFLTTSETNNILALDSFQLGQLQNLASPMATEISNAMGGALVARLVQTCLVLLTTKDSDFSSSCGDNDNSNIKRSSDNNPTLHLVVLKTLQILMISIPIDTLWKSILPGCFAGIYRCSLSKLRYSSSASTHKVASEAILAMSLLLIQSMKNKERNRAKHESDLTVTESLMAAIQKSNLQVKTSMVKKAINESSKQTKDDLEFKNEVNARLPGPLSVLLSLVSTNRSHVVKQKGLLLCRIFLIDTRSTWTQATSTTLGKKALEYCLTVLADEEDELSSFSCQVLNDYKLQLGVTEWKRLLSETAAPTMLELIEMLPILATSGKDVEVRNYLRIIDGYLLVSFRGDKGDDVYQTKHTLGQGKSDVRAALSCGESAKLINDAFSVIFSPDTESMTYKPIVEPFSVGSNEVEIYGAHHRQRFLYLQDETINAARHTIRLLARTFGTKRCAYIIDSCIADMFQSCVERNKAGYSNVQLTWSGTCVYCTELLAGLQLDGRASKSRELKMLSSLASSIFPVIISEPLWTMPTTLDSEGQDTNSLNNLNGFQITNLKGAEDSVAGGTTTTNANANAVFLCFLMDIISQFAKLLDQEIKLHLPIILLPLLVRASSIGNHSSVQNLAVSTLGVISKSAACSDMYSFIGVNFDYILDAVSIRIRKHAKERSRMPRSMMGVINLVLQSTVRHGSVSASHFSMLDYMLTCLLNYFDRQYDDVTSQQDYLDTIRVFRAIISFVDESIIEEAGNKHFSNTLTDHKANVLQRLDDELNLGSASYFGESIDEFATEEVGRDNVTDDVSVEKRNTKHTKEIHTVNAVLARCSYIVCSDYLKIQVLGCDTILAGFRSLWKIGDLRMSLHGESASNPLLPAISELWPTIIRRLRTASYAHISSRRRSKHQLPLRHVIAKDQDQSTPQISLEALVSKCLEIISQLCILSDGFFSGRFENDVFPVLAKLLEADILFEDHLQVTDASSKSLIVSILQCLRHTFESSCGKDLASLVPPCGSMLLPILSNVYTGDSAADTFKAMLKIDSGCLWRGLHKLSGRSFPHNPLRSQPSSGFDAEIVPKQRICAVAERHANDLLDFIDSLPEQQLS